MAVQWCSATSLNRWCHRPAPRLPLRASAYTWSPFQQPRKIGFVSVPREFAAAAAAEAALPEVEADMEVSISLTPWTICRAQAIHLIVPCDFVPRKKVK